MTDILITLLCVSGCGLIGMGVWVDSLQRRLERSDERIAELMAQLRETDGERAKRLRKQLDESDDELASVQDLNRLYEKHFGEPLL